MKRYGVEGGKGTGGQHMPFARAVEADGWLFVSGQTPMENGEVINGGIVEQSHKAIQNVFAILKEAGYGAEHVVRCGVWLDDPRDFASFNKVFREYFGDNPPARACVVSSMVIDCRVEVDCVAYKKPTANLKISWFHSPRFAIGSRGEQPMLVIAAPAACCPASASCSSCGTG